MLLFLFCFLYCLIPMHVINAVFFLMCVSSFSSISEAEASAVLEQTNPDMEVETVPVTSLWSLVCDLQSVIASQQELLASKDAQIANLQAIVKSQQETNKLQEQANSCLWDEVKSAKSLQGPEAMMSVAEEIVPHSEAPDAAGEGDSFFLQ